jgi:pimeloyl-ACP methyl ester carboxylesterase
MLIALTRLLVRLLPRRPANWVIRRLAARTSRPAILPSQQLAIAQASPLRYGEGGRNAAWSWGEGPLVVLVHGWNGRAAQMAPLAASLASAGFRCVAIDVTGHGTSRGQRTSWRNFIADVSAATAELTSAHGQPVHAYVGHSAGGLALMAARRITGIAAKHYVCICAPSHPYPPVRAVQQRLAPPQPLLMAYRDAIAAQFDAEWSQLETGRAFFGAGADLLLVYDQTDRYVDHADGDLIQARCPGSRLVKTAGHGHTKVLAAPEVARHVVDFISA